MAQTDRQTNRHTDGHGDSMNNSAQWGRVGENNNTPILHTCLTLCWSCHHSTTGHSVVPLLFWVVRVKKQKTLVSSCFHQLGPTGPSWSVSRHVLMSVCMSVPSRNTHFRRSCRPLVEDRVPNIGLGWHLKKKRGVQFFGEIVKTRDFGPPSKTEASHWPSGRGGTNPNFFWPGWFQVPFVITNHTTIFFFTKNTVWPPLPGVWKNGPPHYMAKNENHPRGLCDSLNEAFWCTDCNAKNLTSLRSLISEKMRKNRQKIPFFQKCPFFTVFLDFFRNGTL